MANREDIRARVRKLNPRALAVMDELDRQLAKLGGGSGVTVTTTEDMTPEEEEMTLFEGFLKEGYPEEIAARKAKEWLIMIQKCTEHFRRQREKK